MKDMNFPEIERKWQKIWEQEKVFETDINSNKKKMYVLGMFPYPSGDLHMGHCRNYTITDVLSRFFRMKNYEVLHPFGWDAFGLPAENAAIKRGIHPLKWTFKNIEESREDIKKMGLSYDWTREIFTCKPDYYKWTQFLFLLLYKKNLAYRKKSYVNFCPSCQTVLANEQIIEGKCERCETPIKKKKLEQWFFKITEYADKLLKDLELLEGKWPREVIEMQRNWIGKSEGTKVIFRLEKNNMELPVFTTRIDTIYGVSFLAIAPEHEIMEEILKLSPERDKLKKYIEKVILKSEVERTREEKKKEGFFTGLYVIHPLTGEKLPLFTAEYVLAHYGTGIVMGVPAHDQRDFEFAKEKGLEIKIVIQKNGEPKNVKDMEKAMEEYGLMVNSGEFSGLTSQEGIKRLNEYLKEKKLGGREISFKIRDWLISRQRYWGAPIPIIYCNKCGIVPVPENDLPVLLPEVVDYTPKGKSPLASSEEFINTKCPECKSLAKRDPDTMDTFVDSSWYFLRYIDPKNEKEIFNTALVKNWLPVDFYVGGIEHATGHLIYSRFIYKVLYDEGMVPNPEPFEKLFTQGMVLKRTPEGRLEMMSKRAGNAVRVRDFVKDKGADIARVYILFAGPPREDFEWQEEGVKGVERFLKRVFRLYENNKESFINSKESPPFTKEEEEIKLLRKCYKTLKKVTEDIERFSFNTAIAALMELLNDISAFKNKNSEAFSHSLYLFIKMLSVFAPHLAEEIWSLRKENLIVKSNWPMLHKEFLKEEKLIIPVQVNGKLRAQIEITISESESEIIEKAKKHPNVKKHIEGKKILKTLYVKNKIINFVVK